MTEAQLNQLVDYVLQQLRSGSSEEAIEQAFLQAGYTVEMIDTIFEAVDEELQPPVESKFQQAVQSHDEQSSQFFEAALYWVQHMNLFKGRLNRSAFAMAWVYYIVLGVIVGTIVNQLLSLDFLMLSVGGRLDELQNPVGFVIILALAAVPMIVIHLSIAARRLHDIGRPTKQSLLLFVPIFNIAMSVYLLIKPGQADYNEYGVNSHTYSPFSLLGVGLYEPPIDTTSQQQYVQ